MEHIMSRERKMNRMSDTISRQAAIDALKRAEALTKAFGYHNVIDTVMELPSAERRGRWIPVTNGRGGNECSICHNYAPSWATGEERLTDYCPNCGARMEVEE